MCETIKPSSWDQGGILRDIFVITWTIDNAIDAALDSPAKFWYPWYMSLDDMMLKKEIADLLNKESYRIWDSAKVIKNQDYHDGLVKGLKMASQFVAKLWKKKLIGLKN